MVHICRRFPPPPSHHISLTAKQARVTFMSGGLQQGIRPRRPSVYTPLQGSPHLDAFRHAVNPRLADESLDLEGCLRYAGGLPGRTLYPSLALSNVTYTVYAIMCPFRRVARITKQGLEFWKIRKLKSQQFIRAEHTKIKLIGVGTVLCPEVTFNYNVDKARRM